MESLALFPDDDHGRPLPQQPSRSAARTRLPRRPQPGGREMPAPAQSRPRRLHGELGAALPVLAELENRHPGDPFAQLRGFFGVFRIPAATGRKRQVAFKTQDKYFQILRRVLDTLQLLNMRIGNLHEISARQVRAVTRRWEAAGASASSLATLNTVLHRFGLWIGKPDLAPLLAQLLAQPERAKRPSSASSARSWEAQGIDPEAVFQAMAAECASTALQLRLGWAFGLRVEEQLMLRPNESHEGELLRIHRGTKGGRARDIRIQAQWELDLIEQAKARAAEHPKGLLSPRRWQTLEQARNHYYYLCRKIGLRLDGRFRCTPHGARHSFAVRRYEGHAGVAAPVLGGPLPPRPLDRASRQAVAQELGHGRSSATAAYVGTVGHLGALARRQHARLIERERLLAGDPQLLTLAREAALSCFCLAGPAAAGERLTGPALVLCECAVPLSHDILKALLERAGQLLGVPCLQVERSALALAGLPLFELPALGQAAGGQLPPQRLLQGQLSLDLEWSG